jgi:hypothetical protein
MKDLHTGPFFFFEETVKSGQNKRSFLKLKSIIIKKLNIFLLLMFEEVAQLMAVY